MNEKEKMLGELPYDAWKDGLPEEREECRRKLYRFNVKTDWSDTAALAEQAKALLGRSGENLNITPPFYCDYGSNIEVGDNFYTNFNCTITDVARVTIGDNVMLGPNVTICTAGHPVHPEPRNSGVEYGISISIGDNCWIGGNVFVNPGVHIGRNVVIGSGSVVTKDIPDNVIAAGVPCRILREITEEDKKYYFKKREFKKDSD